MNEFLLIDIYIWINKHTIDESAGNVTWGNLNQIIWTMYVNNSLININCPIHIIELGRFSRTRGQNGNKNEGRKIDFDTHTHTKT